MEDWIKTFKDNFKAMPKKTAAKSNPYFKEKILNTLNNLLLKEEYQFNFDGNRLIPDNIKKALNSELGTPTGTGQSTTKEVPSEIVRTFVVKMKSNKEFLKHFDLKIKLDRPNEIFQIDVITKDKEK